VNAIEDYGRRYYFRNFRRDRANFGDPGAYFNSILMRTMLPVRQVADELIYKIITSPSVVAAESQCDSKFFRDSIDSGEIGNLCDSAVLQKYAQAGVAIQDWSQIVYLLLKDDLSGFRKDPKTYKANGFADLIYANYQASNFFVNVLGTPEPGQYYPMQTLTGYQLEPLPRAESEEQMLMAYLASKGVTGEQAQTLLPKIKGNIVDLKPGPIAKSLLSQVSQDGSFKQVDVMGNLYDKLAAVIIIGARGLPVEKYYEASFTPNLYFLPQTKSLASGLMSALVNENNMISAQTVKTRKGVEIEALLPASLNLNTKYYGVITSMTDFISDQNQEFSDKMRICNASEQGCQDVLGRGIASFKGANGQDVFRAAQVSSGDSIVFNLIQKGEELSKQRDTALEDIKNKPQLIEESKKSVTTGTEKQKALQEVLDKKAPELSKKLSTLYGDKEGTLWNLVSQMANDPEKADPSQVEALKGGIEDLLAQAQEVTKADLAKDEKLLKEVLEAEALVENNMKTSIDLIYRVAVSPLISDKVTQDLGPIEADAKMIRYIRAVLNVD
jgi:hypothetical protein